MHLYPGPKNPYTVITQRKRRRLKLFFPHMITSTLSLITEQYKHRVRYPPPLSTYCTEARYWEEEVLGEEGGFTATLDQSRRLERCCADRSVYLFDFVDFMDVKLPLSASGKHWGWGLPGCRPEQKHPNSIVAFFELGSLPDKRLCPLFYLMNLV